MWRALKLPLILAHHFNPGRAWRWTPPPSTIFLVKSQCKFFTPWAFQNFRATLCGHFNPKFCDNLMQCLFFQANKKLYFSCRFLDSSDLTFPHSWYNFLCACTHAWIWYQTVTPSIGPHTNNIKALLQERWNRFLCILRFSLARTL